LPPDFTNGCGTDDCGYVVVLIGILLTLTAVIASTRLGRGGGFPPPRPDAGPSSAYGGLNRGFQMIKIVTAAVLLLASQAGAMAAPFCLAVPMAAPMCVYYDGAACSREANRQNGTCEVNPNEVTLKTSRIGDYCVVMPDGSSTCGYADPNQCSRDALQQKGACSRAAGALPKQLPDAYAPNAGR
jgi:hypothetical protein